MRIDRRRLLRGALLATGGAAVGVAGTKVRRWVGPDRLPLGGGYASGNDRLAWTGEGQQNIVWHVTTEQPLVALTFDDGPGPQHTPKVLDVLDACQAPATFFMVGERLAKYHSLVEGRLARHEVGNHTWNHCDLAERDYDQVYSQLRRTHDEIDYRLGRTARLMRPPWGHFGGSTVLAANALGYDIALWSHQMHEARYRSDPAAQVHDIVTSVRPGAVILAHDYGDSKRLVALDHLAEMIAGIRHRGLCLVTLSELLAVGRARPRQLIT